MRRAVFLDRDGTIIEDRGYLDDPREVVFYPDTINALRRLQDRFLLFIVTNQSGVGHGIIGMDGVHIVNEYVVGELAKAGVEFADVYVCPHVPEDDCACRKPKPFFAEKAAADYGIDLSRSFSIGDHPSDVELGRCFGGQGVYVLTGHGISHQQELPDDYVVTGGLSDAVEWILQHGGC